MKDIYLEIIFWIGAIAFLALLLIGVIKLIRVLFNLAGRTFSVLWNVYEYVIHKDEFDKWTQYNNDKDLKNKIH